MFLIDICVTIINRNGAHTPTNPAAESRETETLEKVGKPLNTNEMGFYASEPVDPAKTTVTYLWTGLRTPGIFIVEVQGDAPNYSYGFTLTRDPHFVGGLKINSMGWTGPLGQGTTPYVSKGSFPGQFQEQIVISGSNGDFLIPVKQIAHTEVDEYVKSRSAAAVPA